MVDGKRVGVVSFAGTISIAWLLSMATITRAEADNKDWPMYNRDVVGWRYNPGETALNNANVGRLEEKWRFPAKDSKDVIGVIHATPVVVNGYVYFGTVNEDPTFYKLSPDGSVRWKYRNPVYTSGRDGPALSEHRSLLSGQL